eukprot:TRINITY_DN14030_c0_g1_i1.p1 TRINITY_DN14030_c0_g1~~TRINITY_DN14030_c0_g1_i1.p1  ORF type:complete len:308 (+),score=69.80 TRINITY_DN14030_c0_g1_i1:156-1079(+)
MKRTSTSSGGSKGKRGSLISLQSIGSAGSSGRRPSAKLLEALTDGPPLPKQREKFVMKPASGKPTPQESAMQKYEREEKAALAVRRMERSGDQLRAAVLSTRRENLDLEAPGSPIWMRSASTSSLRPGQPRFAGKDASAFAQLMSIDRVDLYNEERYKKSPGLKQLMKLTDSADLSRGADLLIRKKFNLVDLADKETLLEAFRQYDRDENYVLDRQEFAKLRRELGFHLTVDEIDKNGDGEIDVDELMAAISVEAKRLAGRKSSVVAPPPDEGPQEDTLDASIDAFDDWLHERMFYGACLHRRPPGR